MDVRAISKYNRVSASKVRLVANEIKGYAFLEAADVLKSTTKKSSKMILKTLYSAGASAKYQNPDILENDLYIKKICIDEGPTLKRYRPRARGRASRIRKRTSTITIVLSDQD